MSDPTGETKQQACAVGMCFFLAEKGSLYCRHHRNIQEAFDAKQRKREEESDGE